MTDCEHFNFNVEANVIRLTAIEGGPVVGYTVEVTANCQDCGEPFEWIGLPIGVLPSEPACSVDGLEARMPLRPHSAPRDFGIALPGFTIRDGEAHQ